MSSFHGIPSIIQPASGATLSAYTYIEVYVGTGGGSATINGMPFVLAAGSNIKIMIRSISDVVGNIYLLGLPINVFQGTPTLSGYVIQPLTLPNPVEGTFTIYAGETYTVNGNLTINGTLIIQSGGTLIITGGTIIQNGTLTNAGTIIFN
jgi:adhesin HecA-like repeat protein